MAPYFIKTPDCNMRLLIRTLLVVGLTLFLSYPTWAQEAVIPMGPRYVVDLTAADTHYIHVTMTVTATGPETELMMATWTPGSYLVREYAKHVDSITAEANQQSLPILKTEKNRWRVSNGPATSFQVNYRVFCKEISVRTNYVDNVYAVLTGAAAFITVPQQMDEPHEVELKLPAAWNGSACSMRTIGDNPHHYLARDFDELVDSPIVAGLVDVYPFEVGGVPHFLVNVNDEGNWDGEKAIRDLTKIVQAHQDFWGCVPYDRYYFLNVINGSGGGLEHDHSCLIMSNQRSMRRPGSYLGWLSLCSHEFFHTWNIRRLRPQPLVDYDYEREAYTPSLWVAEGITSYYEDLLLVRAGLMDPAGFVRGLSRQIAGVQNREGRKVQSLRDSSHDAWIKFYRPAENSRDTEVSYYSKGAVAGFLLDMEIRKASQGQHSLDDVMRSMFEKHATSGYLPEDFRGICSELAGVDLNPWFASTIDGTDELEFQNVADWLGMQVGETLPSDADASQKPKPKQVPWIGLGEADSPADQAGLREDDEILAIDGKRIKEDLDKLVSDAKAGQTWDLLVDRQGRIQNITLTVGSRELPIPWSMSLIPQANVRQRINRHNWFDAPAKEVVVLQPTIYKWTKQLPQPETKPLQ